MKFGVTIYGLLAALRLAAAQVYQLDAIEFPDGACEPVLLRQTQVHKDLLTGHSHPTSYGDLNVVTHVERQPQPKENDNSTTLLKIFGASEQDVWDRLKSECSPPPWPVRAKRSDGFLQPTENFQIPLGGNKQIMSPLPPPPPLKVTPLLISGPSDNRIDLVFFGDGCEYLLHLCFAPILGIAWRRQ